MTLRSPVKISHVFRSIGQPTVTYVNRADEQYEDRLKSAILTSGQLCLITGPSKTGKTTLYKKVLSDLGRQAIVLRCDKDLSANEFWARALESIDFSRLKELQNSDALKIEGGAKVGGKIGWPWLAHIIGEAKLGVSAESTEAEVKERVLARPSPMHLIPLLKKLPLSLVVEDYHYLSASTKEVIFQQWKSFIDEEVSVIVLSTTHHAVDMITANRDLLARVSHIEVSRWQTKDLEKIVQQGFDHLQITIRSNVKELIANESVGLPILTQQCCEQMFLDKGVIEYGAGAIIDFTRDDARAALQNLARAKYGQLESDYNRIIVGPRKRARTYDTYNLILSCFAQEPIKFSLQRHEIVERLELADLSDGEKPPAASITSTLRALGAFQSRAKIELLEWQHDSNTLYILEPAFLFYLRWRGMKQIEADSREPSNSILEISRRFFRGQSQLRDVKFYESVRYVLVREPKTAAKLRPVSLKNKNLNDLSNKKEDLK